MPENIQGLPADPSVGVAAPPMSSVEAPMADPSLMGGQPQVDPEQEAEMRFDLERMLGQASSKDAAFKEKQVLNSEKLEGLKSRIAKEMFSLMEDLGVDPSNLDSINEFLQKLQYQYPDLYVLFESVMVSLSPEVAAPGMEAAPAPGMPGMAPALGIPGMAPAPGMPGMEAAPVPGMEAAPVPGMPGTEAAPIPIEGGGDLMENNSTNLQENILRK